MIQVGAWGHNYDKFVGWIEGIGGLFEANRGWLRGFLKGVFFGAGLGVVFMVFKGGIR